MLNTVTKGTTFTQRTGVLYCDEKGDQPNITLTIKNHLRTTGGHSTQYGQATDAISRFSKFKSAITHSMYINVMLILINKKRDTGWTKSLATLSVPFFSFQVIFVVLNADVFKRTRTPICEDLLH